jgi:hypothetical protein
VIAEQRARRRGITDDSTTGEHQLFDIRPLAAAAGLVPGGRHCGPILQALPALGVDTASVGGFHGAEGHVRRSRSHAVEALDHRVPANELPPQVCRAAGDHGAQ